MLHRCKAAAGHGGAAAGARLVPVRCRHRSSGAVRAAAAAPAAAAASPAAITDDVLQQIRTTNEQWLQHALANRLVDAESGCTVVLLGSCFFAPLQDELVAAALQQLPRIDHVLIEQPSGTSSAGGSAPDVLLPYPAWLQVVMDCSSPSEAGGSIRLPEQPQQPPASWVLELQQQLAALPVPSARVGRTIADPTETFGFFPGLDLVLQPGSCSDVLQQCGYLPGRELALAAQHALLTGAQLSCIDAPLKLQEPWVKQLLAQVDDRLFEQRMRSYNPLTDLAANERLLAPAAAAWDQQLASRAQQLDLAARQQQQPQPVLLGRGEEGPPLSPVALSLYKVAKASAAATLSPAAAPEAIERMQRLQPLKWGHFNLRQRYMARQIKEAAATLAANARQHQQAGQQAGQQQQQQSFTLLAVVGRQHVHAMQQMWQDKAAFWAERMPRSFAPSVVERLPDAGDSSAGSASSSASTATDNATSPTDSAVS